MSGPELPAVAWSAPPPLVSMAGVLGALALALGAFRWAQVRGWVSDEGARKGVHVSMGAITLALPWLFDADWPVLVLCGLAVAAMLALRLARPLREHVGGVLHGVARESVGDLVFPVAVCGLYLLAADTPVFYAIPLLLLGLADPAAALVGLRHGQGLFETVDGRKSREGSVAFLAVAFLCVHVPLLLATELGRLECLLVAVIVALLMSMVEAVAWRGLDNLFVPLGTYLVLVQTTTLSGPRLGLHLAVIVALIGVAAVLRRRTTLGGAGVLAAALVAYVTWAFGGLPWLIAPLLVYALYTRLWRGPAADGDVDRPHTVLNVLSVTSVGTAWLFAARALDQPWLIVPYTAAYAGYLAAVGVERLALQRDGWTGTRMWGRRALVAAAPAAVVQTAGLVAALGMQRLGAPLWTAALGLALTGAVALAVAVALARWGRAVDGTTTEFATRVRRAALVGALSTLGLAALPWLAP